MRSDSQLTPIKLKVIIIYDTISLDKTHSRTQFLNNQQINRQTYTTQTIYQYFNCAIILKKDIVTYSMLRMDQSREGIFFLFTTLRDKTMWLQDLTKA